jgi:hypothetical protein
MNVQQETARIARARAIKKFLGTLECLNIKPVHLQQTLDRSAHATDASLTDTGASVTLTYWPSEFSQVRAQYRRTNYETAPSIVSAANELLFQFQFSIGAHGAHPF